MKSIRDFDNYYYKDNNVYRVKDNSLVTKTKDKEDKHYVKLKSNKNKWKSVSMRNVVLLTESKMILPKDAVELTYTKDTYIDTNGNIYSFTNRNINGIVLKPFQKKNGYPCVNIIYKGKRKTVSVHKLVAETFIMKDYVENGFVCMHKDDNKSNYCLDNLSVGTYSQNNKDAYKTGVNKSKNGSIIHSKLSSKSIDWSQIDLNEMINKHKGVNTRIAKEIGCSDTIIRRKRNELDI